MIHSNKQKIKYIVIMTVLMFGYNNCSPQTASSIAVSPSLVDNSMPTVNLGVDSSIQLPTSSKLVSATVSDIDGTIVSHVWSQISGPNTASFPGTNASSQNFAGLVQGTYIFRLVVVDDKGGSAQDEIQIIVQPVSNYAFTYYISPSGNDTSGTGSQVNPWRSLYKASTTINTQNTLIRLAAGTYTETQTVNLPVGVSLQGEGDSTIVKSNVNNLFGAMILLQSAEGTLGNQSVSYLKLDGNNLTTSVGLVVAGRSNVVVHNITAVDFKEVAINFSGITNWTGSTEPAIYSTGNSFHHNNISNSSNYLSIYGTGNVQVGGQEGFLLYSNTISQPSRGQGGQGIGWPLKMANEGYVKGLKIYDNTFVKAPYTGTYGGDNGWNFAVEFWNLYGGLEIYNNNVQGSIDLCKIIKGNYSFGAKIHDNIVTAAAISGYYEGGVILEVDIYDTTVENNVFRNVASGVEFAPHDYGNGVGYNVSNVAIRKNLFENIGFTNGGQGQAIRWHNTDVNPQTIVRDIYIDNNTIVAAAGNNAAIVGIGLPGYQGPTPSNRIFVRNNIVKGFSAFWTGSNIPQGLQNLTIANNIAYQNGLNDEVFWAWSNPQPPSVNYVNSQNLKVDPMLAADFKLQNGSPAIDTGINVGLQFLGLAPDRGAFEKQ